MVNLHENLQNSVEDALLNLLEENRRETFKKWVFNKKETCNADKMAEAGFIYTGSKQEPDAVKCFFCGKSLDGWEPTDDPWKEHLSHSPDCSFAKLQTPQDNISLNTFLDLRIEFIQKIIDNFMDALVEKVEQSAKEDFEECDKTLDKL